MSEINNLKSVIYGCSSTSLTNEEKDFFSKNSPLGIILFKRNCENKEQIRKLIAELKEVTGNNNLDILIDQEGGRVARLRPPIWRDYKPAKSFSDIVTEANIDKAKEAVYINNQILASELKELGITINCTPVVDLLFDDAHDIVGDRSFGKDPEIVSILANEVCNAHLNMSIMPIIKHIPGHGRAKVDSHHDLPVVKAKINEMEKTDFLAFKKMNNSPWAMTAHIIYEDIDAYNTATCSNSVIDYIRNEIGFDGVLVTDDLSMKALGGSFKEKVEKSLDAGCDIVLHCNGEMDEMLEIASAARNITEESANRIIKARNMLNNNIENIDINILSNKLDSIFSSIEELV